MTLNLIAKLFLEIVASPSKKSTLSKDFDKTIGHEKDDFKSYSKVILRDSCY